MRRLAPAKLAAGYARNGIGAIRASGSGCRPGHRACYRTQFSKPEFTQPQLLAILCLPRNQDWTYRETEVRLSVAP